MKQTRSIRLFFISTVIIVIACFWLGFLFGKKSQAQVDLAKYSENQITQEKDTSLEYTSGETLTDSPESETANTENFQTPDFYLKKSGEFLTVYVAATDEIYFETDLKVSDLPIELQEEAEQGILFYDLEDLYHFLENYSS